MRFKWSKDYDHIGVSIHCLGFEMDLVLWNWHAKPPKEVA